MALNTVEGGAPGLGAELKPFGTHLTIQGTLNPTEVRFRPESQQTQWSKLEAAGPRRGLGKGRGRSQRPPPRLLGWGQALVALGQHSHQGRGACGGGGGGPPGPAGVAPGC